MSSWTRRSGNHDHPKEQGFGARCGFLERLFQGGVSDGKFGHWLSAGAVSVSFHFRNRRETAAGGNGGSGMAGFFPKLAEVANVRGNTDS